MKKLFLTFLCVLSCAMTMSAQIATFPWTQNFASMEDFETFSITDANADGQTWVYDDYVMGATCSRDDDADDWLVSPAFTLEGGRTYELSFNATGYSGDVTETFTVYLGTSPTSFTQALHEGSVASDQARKVSVRFQAATSGNYHFAIVYTTSGVSYSGSLTITNLRLDYGQSLGAPAAVTDFSVMPGDRGALSANVSFRTPTQTVGGAALTSLSSVKVLRDGTVVKTFSTPSPGTALSYVDNNVKSGLHTYSVVAVNAEGEGETSEASIYVGVDQPAAPRNVHATYENGRVTLTWEAPTGGVNGGYVDTAALTYNVKNNRGKVVGSQLSATRFEETVSVGTGQSILYYDVQAVSSTGSSQMARSNRLIFGTPDELPYYESFPKGKASHYWAIDYDHLSRWWPMDASDAYTQDADGGLLGYTAMELGEWSRYLSGPISLKGADSPVLTFYYRYEYASADPFKFEIARNGGELEVVRDLDVSNADQAQRWQKVTIDLKDYVGSDFIQIAFSNRSTSTTSYTYVDNISIINQLSRDLRVRLTEVPRDLKVGESRTFTAVVTNVGTEAVAAGDYSVEIWAEGERLATTRGRELAPEASRNYIINATANIQLEDSADCYAVAVYAEDQFMENNTSEKMKLSVKPNYFPVPASLTVDTDGNLAWTAPEEPRTEDGSVTDSFEEAPKWAITDFLDWTLYDGDQGPTWSTAVNGEQVVFPNTGKPYAWIIMDAPSVGLPSSWNAHTGSQLAVSMSTANSNDNWLISPQLSGNEQSISFYVRGLRTSDQETYQVLYSTTDVAPTSFRLVSDAAVVVSAEWVRAEYDLPQGAKYFAIRSIREKGFALLVDDVTFCPDSLAARELNFQGYNVYRNGVRLNVTPISVPAYSDTEAPENATYRVTAVYAEGESAYSQPAYKGMVGIAGPSLTTRHKSPCYDLQGRRLNREPQHGIFLKDGKKMMK